MHENLAPIASKATFSRHAAIQPLESPYLNNQAISGKAKDVYMYYVLHTLIDRSMHWC